MIVGGTDYVRFCLLPLAQRCALQRSGTHTVGKSFLDTHNCMLLCALSHGMGAGMLAVGRQWEEAKSQSQVVRALSCPFVTFVAKAL